MAVTNQQIIMQECILHGILEDVNTYAGWLRAGYQVQKGSKALFTTGIWKPCKKGDSKFNSEKCECEEKTFTRMAIVKSAFFGRSQVEKIEDATEKEKAREEGYKAYA